MILNTFLTAGDVDVVAIVVLFVVFKARHCQRQ